MKRITKGIAFLLCISMLFGLCPSSAYATGSDAALNPIEEPVPDQELEPTQETIVELGWESCQYMDASGNFSPNNTLVKASGKEIISISAIWNEEYEDLLLSLYGEAGEFEAYDINVEGYKEGDTLTLSFEMGLEYFVNGVDNLKIYWIDTVEDVVNTEELTIQKKEFHTEADGVEFVTVTFETTKTGVFAIGNVEEVPEEPQTRELIIKNLPSKLEYQLGEAFDKSGLEVVYVENDIETPLSVNEYTVTADLLTKGPQTVTVTYGELTASFDIWVRDPNNRTKVGIYVKELPTKTEYVVGETFDRTGLVVAAYYDNNTEDTIGTYVPTEPDMTTPGVKPVTVTEGNDTAVFYITVKEPQPEHVVEKTTVTLEDDSELTVEIATNALENVTYKITDVHNYIWVNTLLSKVYDGDYIALNIQPDENFIPGEKTTVTLPLPEHITSPAVYCLTEEEGIVERIMDVTVEDKTVSFVTDHFSVYAIGEGDKGDRYPVVIEEPAWVPLNGWAEKEILILDASSADYAHAMASNGGEVVDQQVTILSEGNQVYIPISDDLNGAVWTIEQSGNQWKFKDYQKEYLTTNDSFYSHSLGIGNADKAKAFDVDVSDGQISYVYDDYVIFNYRYKVRYGSNKWSLTRDSVDDLTFFEKGTISKTYQLALKINDVESEGAYTCKTDDIVVVSHFAVPDGGTISYESLDPEIATVDSDTGIVTLTGKEGQTIIQASYTWEEKGISYTTKAYFNLFAEKPVYTIDIVDQNDQSITNTIPIKNVSTDSANPTTHQLDAKLTRDGDDAVIDPEHVTWISSDPSIATVEKDADGNCNVIFTGEEGSVQVTVLYTYADGSSSVTDNVMFSVKQDDVTIPSDGTDDFPEYPNEGSIRFDKNATAVGNFSDTGVVQVELSMTGVPYTVGNEIDVVMMLDMSTSMDENGRDENASKAAQEALKILVTNEDGTFNRNRVAIYGFNGWDGNKASNSSDYDDNRGEVYEYHNLDPLPNDKGYTDNQSGANNFNIAKIYGMEEYGNSSYQNAINDIANYYTKGGNNDIKKTEPGTNYAAALRQCYLTLKATKDPNRKQYVIFMTDGFASTGFAYKTTNGYDIFKPSQLGFDGLYGVQTMEIQNRTEYFSTQMKNDGVEIFSVGLQVGQGDTKVSNQDIEAGKTVLKKIAGIGQNNANDKGYEKYAMFVDADSNASEIVDIFKTITMSIKQAATNVVVTDKIADEYTMIFEPPKDQENNKDLFDDQELYIEVLNYELEPVTVNGTITDYVRGEADSLSKIYLKRTDDNYSAVDEDRNSLTPAFEKIEDTGTKKYWKLVTSGAYDVEVGNLRYKFMPKGDGTHNMVSGAYASGTVDDNSETVDGNHGTTSSNLKIASPYFFYDASTRILVWTAEKLDSYELALSYFLYLDKSAGWENEDDSTLPGTYETNDYATLRYTNHLGNNCEQEFPVPQMTWNGAQVSYVFYLVNTNGQPVNRAGRVIPFSEAVYITDVFTQSIVWNDLEESGRLTAGLLAKDLVPDVYALFDPEAAYTIHVFEDEEGSNLNNHFKIDGDVEKANTTYVFNTKSDAKKYTELGIYAGKNQILCKDYNVTVNGESYIYNGDENNQYIDEKTKQYVYGTETIDGVEKAYTIVYQSVTKDKLVDTGFDFSNTTVAFAVTWVRELVPDTIVMDYGLDVVIDVAYNDGVEGKVVGVRKDPHESNFNGKSGRCIATKNSTADVYLNNINGEKFKIGTASLVNNTSVRFSLDKKVGMQMKDWAQFYYESTISYYNGTDLKHQDMYTSVTVIPATTIYYEDEYVTLSTLTKNGSDIVTVSGWQQNSQQVTDTQQVDRPGPDKIGAQYDADNEYGSDAAYLKCSTTSMDSSAWIHVESGKSGTAEFEFYGTGFDIISATSHKTGTIVVQVTDSAGKTKNYVVDTYYGYQYEKNPTADNNHDGTIDENDCWVLISGEQKEQDNSLWQIPVMKIAGLEYGHYRVKITVSYSAFFDQNQYDDAGYDFYLDAIRIYDPAGRENANQVIKDAYIADHEYLPQYYELRNLVIDAALFDEEENAGENTDTSTEETTDTNTEANVKEKVLEGILYIDGRNDVDVTTNDISDYISYGPNNELYLEKDKSIVFTLNAIPATGYVVDTVQLAWKSIAGNTTAKIWSAANNENSAKEISVETATDMYFDITDLNGETVIIKNTGDNILSITNIKVTAKAGEPVVQNVAMFSVSRSAVQQAMLSLNNEIVEPEPPKKEETTPVPEPPKKEETKPVPESPKTEETTTVPESATPEPPKAETSTLVPESSSPESPKTEETTSTPELPKTEETSEEPSESGDGNQVMDELETPESETEKPEETKKKGIIDKLIEFIKKLIRSIFNLFSRWF